ncbi:MAG TPA: glycosyltransferase family 4 protein [Gemmatimonadaceae bacterium]|nr:glycosyltransferase family 4 protein [Gemmatimonadaceae bacterium]
MNKTSKVVVAMYSTAESWRGAGISFVNIARGLERHGIEVRMIATMDEVAREFVLAGLSVCRLPSDDFEALRLRRKLSDIRADLVVVDRAHDLRVATRAVVGTRVGIINRYNLFRAKVPADLMTRVAYRDFVKEIIFLSDVQRTRVLAAAPFMGSTPATTIHEGINADSFRPDTAAAEAFRRTYKIVGAFLLAVGALTAEKRYDFMLESLSLLGDEAPPLIICGEGVEEEKIRQHASSLRLDVRMLGRIPREHLSGACNASAGLVHAGCVETFGLSVLEAMACGSAIVACNGGALPEVVGTDGGAGTLVDADSREDMANAIRCLFTEPGQALAMGARARERALRFALGKMEKAYADVVHRHTRGGSV